MEPARVAHNGLFADIQSHGILGSCFLSITLLGNVFEPIIACYTRNAPC